MGARIKEWNGSQFPNSIHSTSRVLNNPDWHDSGERPFDTADEATTFAEAEVGAAWIVVDSDGRPAAYGDGLGVRYRPTKRSVGLDPFGISPTATLGNMKLEIHNTWHEHAGEHTDLAIRGNLSLNIGVGVIRGLDDEELGSFAFCPHCGILRLNRERGANRSRELRARIKCGAGCRVRGANRGRELRVES